MAGTPDGYGVDWIGHGRQRGGANRAAPDRRILQVRRRGVFGGLRVIRQPGASMARGHLERLSHMGCGAG